MSPLSDPLTGSADDATLQLRTRQMMAPVRAVTRRARELGITVAAATDGSYGDGDSTARIRIAHDLAALQKDCGFTSLEAIQAATLNGARVLGISARTGAIRPGLEADLLVVERDPLRDGSALFEPLLVVSDGLVLFERQ
jgi:imidazolonepropionase-like amidohydrolase